jgi:hypothetical protein
MITREARHHHQKRSGIHPSGCVGRVAQFGDVQPRPEIISAHPEQSALVEDFEEAFDVGDEEEE